MRFTIITYGSQGDIRPLVALGAGLVRAGHTVAFPADREFRGVIERHGLEYHPLSGDLRALTSSGAADDLFRKGINPVAMTRALVRLARDHQRVWTRESLEAARGSDAVIASGLGFYMGFGIAETLGVPCIGAALQPMAPTRAFGPPMMPPPKRPLPGFLNMALHWSMMQMIWLAFRPEVEKARAAVLGLPPMGLAGPGPRIVREKWPVLYGHSDHVIPRPADWPDFITVTGYWFLDEAERYRPPADLLRFLDEGEPPVYVGFGSMGGYDPAETTALILAALGDRRAVLSAGWGGLDRSALPKNVHGLDSAPHDWLFARMAAVVHHGGAGTTAAGLRAGKPSVVVPFLADQPFWGRRVQDLGVGPAPLRRDRLTPAALAAAIAATDDPAMRARAADLGRRLHAEDGVGNAVRVLERVAG